MIDATAFGPLHIQIFQVEGMSAHSLLLTRNTAWELYRKLGVALREPQDELESLIPDD